MAQPITNTPFKPPVFKEALAYKSSSKTEAETLIEEAMKLSKNDDFVLILKDEKEIEERMLPAYVSALIRQSDGSMHSKSLSLETMMFIAGTMNIGNAVKKAAASGSGKFIIFSSSRKLSQGLASKFKLKLSSINLSLDPKVTSKVALTAIKEDK